jgi:hypothetical protein
VAEQANEFGVECGQLVDLVIERGERLPQHVFAGAHQAKRPSWTCPTRQWPCSTRAAKARPEINGELVVWTGERMDFDALQQRMVNSAATVRRRLAPARPASLVVFDVLSVGSVDVRPMRWTARRGRLESLAETWRPPLQLSPVTTDVDEAREWLEAFKASGVEGLVVKGATSRYQPGRREWVKVKSVGVSPVRFGGAVAASDVAGGFFMAFAMRDICRA